MLVGVLALSQVLPPTAALLASQGLLFLGAILGVRLLPSWRGLPSVKKNLSLTAQPVGEIVLAGAAAVLLMPGLQMLFDRVYRLFSGYAEYLADQQAIIGNDSLGLGYGILFLAVVVLPPLCEEAFFRGYLSSSLRSSGMSQGLIVLFGGLLFGLFHLDPWRLVPVSILGMLMVWLVETGGSLLAGAVFHLVNNGIVFLIAVLASSETTTITDNAQLSPGQIFLAAGLFVLGGLVLASYAKRARIRRSKGPRPFEVAGRPGSGL